jgi:outer membrane protein OmpA-like peptidoglycan-associated protein
MIQREFETEMAEFRSEMLQAQAKRDSALIMALANRSLRVEEEEDVEPITTVVQADPQEISITQQEVDDKTFRKIQRNQEKSINRLENLEEKNNRLLRDALLIGGTAAATTAITNDRKDKTTSADTALVAKVQEPIATDSINLPKTNVIPVPVPGPTVPVIRIDTVFVENEKSASPRQAKIEVYFEINKTTLSKSEIAKLDPLKILIERNPQEYLELTGFADNTGSIAYNLKLTEKRVESVKKILMEQYQIPEEKIKAGDGGLIVRGRNSGSKEKDRKVEINLINE